MIQNTKGSAPRFTRRAVLAGMLAVGASTLAAPAFAQAPYPSQPIRMIVSVGAGGATDAITRRLADKLAASMGATIVVENMPGASGVIAAQAVARAEPDGYTLLIGTNTTHAGNASFLKNLPYDPINDFEPISRLGVAALVLSVNNDVPIKTVPELVAYAKANPGKLNYGSGTGSARLATEMFQSKTGIKLVNVPYKSNAQALSDLRGGQIQILMGDIALMLPQIQAGTVKGLGVSSAKRSAAMPDMPSLQELGIKDYELVGFIAAFAPAKTPQPIVRKLNEEIGKVLRDKEFAESLSKTGVDAAPTTPEGLREWVVSETEKWRQLATAAGIKPE